MSQLNQGKGQDYEGLMPSFAVSLNDEEITLILNHILVSFNNHQEDEINTKEIKGILNSGN